MTEPTGISNFICRPTAAEVVALCETVPNKNFVTDAEKTQIGIDLIQTAGQVKAAVESFTGGDRITLDNFQEGAANKVFSAAEETKLGNINLGASGATDDEIIALLAAATSKLTADSVIDGTTNKAYTGVEQTKLAAIPEFEELEHEYDIAVSTEWADAIPGGSVITNLRYINKTEVVTTTAVSYKIELTGGTTVDLETAIGLTKNTKSNLGLAGQLCEGTTAVSLTPNAGTLDTGTVLVGITVRKPKSNYPNEV